MDWHREKTGHYFSHKFHNTDKTKWTTYDIERDVFGWNLAFTSKSKHAVDDTGRWTVESGEKVHVGYHATLRDAKDHAQHIAEVNTDV